MKKFTASCILGFIAPFTYYLMVFANGASSSNFMYYSLVTGAISAAFGLTAFFLRLSACKDLAPQNPGFFKQRTLYIWHLVYILISALITGVLMSMVMYPLFYSMSDDGTLTQTHIIIYMVVSDIVIKAGTVFAYWVEYSLLKNIRVLGQGKKIGHRALRSVWYASVLLAAVNIVRGFWAYGDRARDMLANFTKEVDLDTPREAFSYSIPELTVRGVISWAISIAFIVCMIRVTVKLGRIAKAEAARLASMPRSDSLEAFYAMRDGTA